ncbi:LysR family transcriptional regulator (plasmid) [Rhizobium sp. CB3090]|uniref:LysR family transcriptional regulator n=1 Tax=Rhizobium sp. CB3090 TaxID=3039156 RepID=UPI0024B163F0|nr:LysR family transcriptional regulator [Rhizobium sp. CB3090]WFU11844.1 LysR family transcriptional regulator [Rhizobium sp. CB3090]
MALIDLRSMQILVAVSDAGSFSAAAIQLDISQSTVSYAIDRLRRAFGDPLFVRQGNRIAETDKCRDLVSQTRETLNRMLAIAVPQEFDPMTAEGAVTLSCNHHERFLLLPAFIRTLRQAAPNVVLNVLESAVNGKQQLKENIADIVLGPVRILGEGYFRRRIFSDHYSCVMDADNPLATGDLTLQRFQNAAHVAITHNGQWQALYFAALRERNIVLAPQLTLPSHDSLELMIVGTDLVATIPNRLASAYGGRLAARPFPIHIPIDIDMYWTERTHKSGLHRWVRQLLADVARAVAPDQLQEGWPPEM